MPKFVIEETFTNGQKSRITIHASNEASALTVADTLLGGNLQALEEPATITVTDESASIVDYIHYNAYCADSATGASTFVEFDAKDTINDLDVKNFLIGKTINGVAIDTVTVKGSLIAGA